jgi:cell division protein FtsW
MFDRTERGLLARWWWTVDRPLLGVLGLLALSGLIMVFAASPPVAVRLGLPAWHFITRHLVYLAPAALLLVGCSLLSPRGVHRAATALLAVALLMLVATLVVGIETNGATRWISIGTFALQPGEFVKPALIVVSAALLARAPGLDNAWPVLGLGLVTMALLLAQPNVSMALMVGAVLAVQLFVAGLPWLLVLAALLLSLLILWQAYLWFPHVAGRIDRFLDPVSGDDYQVGLALKAVKSAAWFGSGPGEGRLKNQIPDAHSDFVFAVAAEEFGLIACLILIGLFAFVVLRGLRRTELVSDRFALIAGAGLLGHFALQAMVNFGVNLSVLPATGMTLPFISYGGSALCSMAVGMGMFLALTRRRLGQGLPAPGAFP